MWQTLAHKLTVRWAAVYPLNIPLKFQIVSIESHTFFACTANQNRLNCFFCPLENFAAPMDHCKTEIEKQTQKCSKFMSIAYHTGSQRATSGPDRNYLNLLGFIVAEISLEFSSVSTNWKCHQIGSFRKYHLVSAVYECIFLVCQLPFVPINLF